MSQTDGLTLGNLHGVIAKLSPFRATMLAFVCGIVTIFAFAPYQIWLVYMLAISLLVWLVDGARKRPRWRRAVFTRGWAFGVGFTLASMHWTVQPFLVDPPQFLYFIWMPLILLPAGLGLFFGLGTMIAGFFWSNLPARIFIFALALSFTEFLRGWIFGGFPWNWPGMVWAPGSSISQLASLAGLFGLSMITLMLSAAPAALADFRNQASGFSRVLPIMISVIVFGLGWGWGSARISHAPVTTGTAVRIIDVGISQDEKYPSDPDGDPVVSQQLRTEAATNILLAYLTALGDDGPETPKLVVWPEAALPIPLLQDPNALDAVALRLGERTLIAGTARVDRYAEPQPKWYNSLAVIDTQSRFRGANAIYDKHRLVPFGELSAADIIPFGNSISSLLPAALQQQATNGFTPGPKAIPIRLDDTTSFLPIICYEALFPGLIRSTAADSDFLVNISIDSWFGEGIGPEQHFAQTRYRAIETGRPLVRAANLGRSGVVDMYGRQAFANIQQTNYQMFPVTVIDTIIPDEKKNTTYARFGSLTTWVLAGFITLLSILSFRNSVDRLHQSDETG